MPKRLAALVLSFPLLRRLAALLLGAALWTGGVEPAQAQQDTFPATPAQIASLVSRVRAGAWTERHLAARELRAWAPLPTSSLGGVAALLPLLEEPDEALVLSALVDSCPAAFPFLERAIQASPAIRYRLFPAFSGAKVRLTPSFANVVARSITDPEVGLMARFLLQARPEGIAHLAELLGGESELGLDPVFREQALSALAYSADTYPDLLFEAVEDPSPKLRAVAVFGLGQISSGSMHRARAMARCEAALADPDPSVREFATSTLETFAPDLGEERLISHLERMLRDSSPRVRINTVLTCRELGPAAAGLVPSLAELLASPDLEVEAEFSYPGYVGDALAAIGTAAKPALPALISAFESEGRPEVARSLKVSTTRIAEGLRDAGDPAWWVPFRVHWKGFLALVLLAGVWFLGMSRLKQPRAAWARFLIAFLPAALIVTWLGVRLLFDDFEGHYADDLTLACIPAGLDEISFLPFALSGPLTAAFPCLVLALWSTGRGSHRIREERDQEAQAEPPQASPPQGQEL